jgi:hypothetical protein
MHYQIFSMYLDETKVTIRDVIFQLFIRHVPVSRSQLSRFSCKMGRISFIQVWSISHEQVFPTEISKSLPFLITIHVVLRKPRSRLVALRFQPSLPLNTRARVFSSNLILLDKTRRCAVCIYAKAAQSADGWFTCLPRGTTFSDCLS